MFYYKKLEMNQLLSCFYLLSSKCKTSYKECGEEKVPDRYDSEYKNQEKNNNSILGKEKKTNIINETNEDLRRVIMKTHDYIFKDNSNRSNNKWKSSMKSLINIDENRKEGNYQKAYEKSKLNLTSRTNISNDVKSINYINYIKESLVSEDILNNKEYLLDNEVKDSKIIVLQEIEGSILNGRIYIFNSGGIISNNIYLSNNNHQSILNIRKKSYKGIIYIGINNKSKRFINDIALNIANDQSEDYILLIYYQKDNQKYYIKSKKRKEKNENLKKIEDLCLIDDYYMYLIKNNIQFQLIGEYILKKINFIQIDCSLLGIYFKNNDKNSINICSFEIFSDGNYKKRLVIYYIKYMVYNIYNQ